MKIKIEAVIQVKVSYEIDSGKVDYVEIEEHLNARANNKEHWIIRDGDGFSTPKSVSGHIADFKTSSRWENPGKPGPAESGDTDQDLKKDFELHGGMPSERGHIRGYYEEWYGPGAFEEMQAAFAEDGAGVDDE